MIKYLIFLILAIFIILYFFISTQEQNSELKPNLKKVEDKKVDLIDNFINTKSNIPIDYKQKDNYNKPKDIENKTSNKLDETSIDVNVDINKDTKELEKIKFKLEKNF